jgi:energy-coupling factor transport system ATP-binding protein
MPALSLSHLTFSYPDAARPALADISFQVEKGEMVAVVGANRSGKSTLCYAIAGVVPHFYHGEFRGQVQIGEKITSEYTVAQLARSVGLVLQIPGNLLSGVRSTVFEEVAFGLENMGVKREKIYERVMAVLELTGLEYFTSRSPYHLSGGEQQRLALAAVLAISPDILALDEPTTFLDPDGTRQIYEILHQLRRQGKTVIIAEQRLEWIALYADRVIVLDSGRMVLQGSPAKVLTDPKIQEAGLEWMPYTEAAVLGKKQGVWGEERDLPVSFAGAVDGFSAG